MNTRQVKMLGSGGSGKVYSVSLETEDNTTDSARITVAVKEVRPVVKLHHLTSLNSSPEKQNMR